MFAAQGIHLNVSTAEGGSEIRFGQVQSLKEDGAPVTTTVTKEVILSITTDLNKRYMVSQMASSALVGAEGAVCPVESIRYTARIKNGSGEVRTVSQTSLHQGQEDIFISGDSGQPAQLTIFYELAVPQGQKAGNYNTSITYKVSTL